MMTAPQNRSPSPQPMMMGPQPGRCASPQPRMMARLNGPSSQAAVARSQQMPHGYNMTPQGMSPSGTPVNMSINYESGLRSGGGGRGGQGSGTGSPMPQGYFQPSANGSPNSSFAPHYASGASSASQFRPSQQQQPPQQGMMLPPRPPAGAAASNGGGGRFHQPQAFSGPGGAGSPQASPQSGHGSSNTPSSGGGYSGPPRSLVGPTQPQQQFVPRPPSGPPQGGPFNARPSSGSPRMNQGGRPPQQNHYGSQQSQMYAPQQPQQQVAHRGNGRGIYGRRPVARGPQPTDMTVTRGPDGRRIKSAQRQQKEAEANEGKQPPRLSPQLNGKRGKVNKEGEVVHKIKTTVENDETWVQPLVYSTWVDSPTQSFAGGGRSDAAGHYKRQPNKKTRKDADKAKNRARNENNNNNRGRGSSDDELSSDGLSSSSSQPPKRSKFVEALRGLFR